MVLLHRQNIGSECYTSWIGLFDGLGNSYSGQLNLEAIINYFHRENNLKQSIYE